jgi:DNA-binding response OmpR family regulator
MEVIMLDILVVEDNENTRILTEDILKYNGYNAIVAENGISALELMEHNHIDLIILDVMMPRMDGFEFAKTLRSTGCIIPILMITAKETPQDIKKGFISGTDDYMVMPVDEEEMLLRIKALLRRSQIVNERKLKVGNTELYFDKLLVTERDNQWDLPQKEFMLLYKLLSYQGTIFTRAQLIDEIWGLDSKTDWHTVDVHINRLRDKFNNNQDFEIKTVRGLGYKAEKK